MQHGKKVVSDKSRFCFAKEWKCQQRQRATNSTLSARASTSASTTTGCMGTLQDPVLNSTDGLIPDRWQSYFLGNNYVNININISATYRGLN